MLYINDDKCILNFEINESMMINVRYWNLKSMMINVIYQIINDDKCYILNFESLKPLDWWFARLKSQYVVCFQLVGVVDEDYNF